MTGFFKLNTKMLLKSPDGTEFIRFVSRKFKLFVKIEVFYSEELLITCVDKLKENEADLPFPFFWSKTSVGESHYLLFVADIDCYTDRERAEKNIPHALKRLAGWYRYAYLIPVAQGQKPVFGLSQKKEKKGTKI